MRSDIGLAFFILLQVDAQLQVMELQTLQLKQRSISIVRIQNAIPARTILELIRCTTT
jgi:hypothetical protein